MLLYNEVINGTLDLAFLLNLLMSLISSFTISLIIHFNIPTGSSTLNPVFKMRFFAAAALAMASLAIAAPSEVEANKEVNNMGSFSTLHLAIQSTDMSQRPPTPRSTPPPSPPSSA